MYQERPLKQLEVISLKTNFSTANFITDIDSSTKKVILID